jgi:LmbE family N-acetylglucosaminyl deacetylase
MNHKIIRTVLALLFVSLLIAAPRAQQPAPVATTQSQEDRVALYQALLDLTNPWTVMCIAAHPDDEDGTSLIVMRRKYGAHTVSVFSTFGEGGQNAIGPELYEELGAIRARETMAAAEIQGSEPYFLGLKDFGYSKSADEAFRVWGHDEALRRMVLQIRKLRPDVIITNHDTVSGHGHHQATGRLVLEAFDAAADPKRFDGMKPWQVQRVFVREGFGNKFPASNTALVTIDPNERDPIRDTTFVEEALRALQKHATQGPWPKSIADMARFRNSPDGKLPLIRYRLVREANGAAPLPANSHYLLDGLELPEEIAKRLQSPTIDGRPLTDFVDQPDHAFDTIRASLISGSFRPKQFLVGFPGESHLHLISRRTDEALAQTSGIGVKIIVANAKVVPGMGATFTMRVTNKGDRPARLTNALFHGFSKTDYVRTPPKIEPGSSIEVKIDDHVPTSLEVTVPHFMHLYDGRFSGQRLLADIAVEVDGRSFLVTSSFDADVVPAVEIADIRPSTFVVTPQTVKNHSPLAISITNHRNEQSGGSLVISTGKSELLGGIESRTDFALRQGEARELSVPMTSILAPRLLGKNPTNAQANFNLSIARRKEQRGEQLVQRSVPLAYADARVATNTVVAYIRGFDYSLPHALDALGVESKELGVEEVKTTDLQKYSAIIVDNRVYESQPELIAANQKLLDYAKDGGTLIVFYHKTNEWNPDPKRNRPQLAPYNLVLGDERITDENASITFIEPEHPLLNFPNKMGQEDFAGWIQERGLYYPKEWDAHYTALLASNDPGEQPLRGGLLVADYGRGHYIYTSMVWYRQLRAGVPGAYRMLANMVSYGRPTN